jgi:hypothetical protein
VGFEWDEFQERGLTPTATPRAGILRRGYISLNDPAYQLLGRPSHVVLLYDPKRRAVGLRPATPDTTHAYQVRKQRDSASYLVSASAFVRTHQIPHDQAIYVDDVYLVDGVLVVELTRSHPAPVGRPRARAGEQA